MSTGPSDPDAPPAGVDRPAARQILSEAFAHPTAPDHMPRLKALAQRLAASTDLDLPRWLAAPQTAAPAIEHSLQVAAIAVALGRPLGLSVDYLAAVALGGLLHDLGRSLSAGVETPPRVSADLATTHHPIPALTHDAIIHHLERFDGSGGPYGLAGEDIPLPGRLVGMAKRLDRARWPAAPFVDDGACDPALLSLLEDLAQRATLL